ncbi:GlxA family transcriptional regulator [Kutzneria kofuensis]|uniref:Transcriptional regulator GlxA family with amidase domain n=1 Tax=Kutzneria kofuensis TaxID=103725 RepID=A0A7W9NKD1_9PSEU|nr:DJ-1/PfpI family protein [Kutzneria kofuensis]MBB5895569.1 transcriptional regulator GlxA family with amidase domain [Kutzneria kofuensis]
MPTVAFLLTPNLHLLDLAGPAQVFSAAAKQGLDYRLCYLADTDTVPTAQGLTVQATTEIPALDAGDMIVVPGCAGDRLTRTPRLGPALMTLLREFPGTVASVCSGAEHLGRAGLLDGRRCTTHHELQDELARRYPAATVVHDVLYVIDGRIVTSAGIASGIDLALHLVATAHGPAIAARIAREMVIYARRNGDDRQASAMLRHRSHINDTVHRLQDHIDGHYTARLPLAELARAVGCSERTVTRLFTRATGLTPLRYQQLLRLERAEHLIGQGATVESAAHAVGFEDARMLRRLRARP